MKKKTQGVLLMIPLSLVMILTLGIGMYLMIVGAPFITLGIFAFMIIILAFAKGIELTRDA